MSSRDEDDFDAVHMMASGEDDDEMMDIGEELAMTNVHDSLSYLHSPLHVPTAPDHVVLRAASNISPVSTLGSDGRGTKVVSFETMESSPNSNMRDIPTIMEAPTPLTAALTAPQAPKNLRNSDLTVIMSNTEEVPKPEGFQKGNVPVIPIPLASTRSTGMIGGIPEEMTESIAMPEAQQRMDRGLILFGLSKTMSYALVFLLLLTCGSGVFFFASYFQIPGLNNQIDELESQVDRLETSVDDLEAQVKTLNTTVERLSGEVDELTVENDRFEELKAELVLENDKLSGQIYLLNSSNYFLESQLATLGNITEQLNTTVSALEEENFRLEQINSILNVSYQEWNASVTELENVNLILVETNAELNATVQLLQNETSTLANENIQLQNLTEALTEQVSDLKLESEILTKLNSQLVDTIQFLNQTNLGVDATLEDTLSTLQGLLDANRALVLSQLRITYEQYLQSWDCNLYDTFAGKAWIENLTLPMDNDQDAVVDFVNDRVLQQLCLDRDDFEFFLGATNLGQNGQNLTVPQMESGVSKYTTQAIEWYFPVNKTTGVSPRDWEKYGFDCTNLPVPLQFLVGS